MTRFFDIFFVYDVTYRAVVYNQEAEASYCKKPNVVVDIVKVVGMVN